MKTLNRLMMGLALLFFAMPVHADNLMSAPNGGGGEIVLTDSHTDKCTPSQKIAFLTTEEGFVVFGCWLLQGTYVFVRWEDGEVFAYPLKAFSIIPEPLQ